MSASGYRRAHGASVTRFASRTSCQRPSALRKIVSVWPDRRIVSPPGADLKVPHMGWNVVTVTRPNPIIATDGEQRFYFVHSYRAVCEREDEVVATCDYGGPFACAYGRDNIYGVQFHPEKSHRFGMELFRRFVAFAC